MFYGEQYIAVTRRGRRANIDLKYADILRKNKIETMAITMRPNVSQFLRMIFFRNIIDMKT